jgi:hypothetical protein
MITHRRLRRSLIIGVVVLSLLIAAVAGAAGGKSGGGGSRTHDTTPPTVAISVPAAGATVSGSVTISGTAADNVGLAKVELSVDGAAYQAASGTASWSYPLDTTTLTNGSHTLMARATDTSGNTRTVSETVSIQNVIAAPSVTIVAPTAGTTVSGAVNVGGHAADTVALTKVELSVDGGAYQAASGTTSWAYPLDTRTLANGSHTLTVRATDTLGATAATSQPVSVSNTAPDATPPTVGISVPVAGATVSGSVTISGAAADNVGLATVELSVDGGAYKAASGTASWSYSLDTTTLANGSHTLTARATDTSGNVSSAVETVSVQNSTSLPTGVVQQLVTPEGVTINIYADAVGWTAQQVYDILKPNALQLSLIGPTLTIDVQGQYASATTASVQGDPTAGYSNYRAIMYLQAAVGSSFNKIPDDVIAHEYGHAWSNYHFYLTHHGDWTSYLQARGLAGNPLLNSSYMWDPREIIAEDYRLLFGDTAAQNETAQMNYQIPDARTVAGLKDFLANNWS